MIGRPKKGADIAFHDDGCFTGAIRPLTAEERRAQMAQQFRAEQIRARTARFKIVNNRPQFRWQRQARVG